MTKILRIFGVISSQEEDSFGFQKVVEEGSKAGVDEEEVVLPYVEVLSEFREKIRTTARSIENPTIKSSILKECDLIRDEKLPNLGIRLEDHEGNYWILWQSLNAKTCQRKDYNTIFFALQAVQPC